MGEFMAGADALLRYHDKDIKCSAPNGGFSLVRRAPKRPCVSVILAAHNAGDHLTRAIESVLNQDYEDLELIVANCASSDRTASVCDRFVDRDIRVEAICVDSNSMSCGRTAACSIARGRYLLFVGQDDWLGAGFLDAMVSAARKHDAQMVIPEFSVDTEQSDGGRVSATLSHDSCFWDGAEPFHRGAAPFVENGVLAFAAGKLFARECIDAMAELPDLCHNEVSFMTGCVRDLASVAVVEGARYHLLQPSTPSHAAFDPGMFDRCQEDYRRLRDLYGYWGLQDDEDAMAAVHRRYLRELIRCIENVCASSNRLSAIERRDRVQGMLDAEPTREAIEAVKESSHEFGIMYAPIARRSAVACFMGARIQDIVGRALLPFVSCADSRL